MADIDSRSKSNMHRINAMEKKAEELVELARSVSSIEVSLSRNSDDIKSLREQNQRDMSELKSDVKTIASKPSKRWDTVVNTLISTIVGALVGAIIALIV